MPNSTIIVNHRDGSPKSGSRVVLSFHHGGVTQEVRTDQSGQATISHSATGSAKVIIDGRTVETNFRAPGRTSFTL